MPGLDELYREVILEHYKNPRNQGHLDHPDVANRGHNPLCGDEIEISLDLKDGRVDDIRFQGRGCSISQASASMLTEAIKGKNIAEARTLIDRFKSLMHGDDGSLDQLDQLGDVEALQGVRKYPVRIKCAMLAWTTLQEGLDLYDQAGQH
ncbi:MAG TPA: SUF system NifU family Fe-S cluster assembly protein [Chloroflexota bacterium]|nr:SUF system NifU family Fe-S cluster assembly protein [Chloroflexota bacterium]